MGLEQDRQQLSPPEKMNSLHQIDSFNSGNNELNYLQLLELGVRELVIL